MKIVIPDRIDIPETDRQALVRLGEVTIYDDVVSDEAVILERIQGAELITAAWMDIGDRLIQSTPSLRYIIVPGVGYDNVDVQAATAAGVKVCNCPTHNATAVAEFTIAAIFAVTRRIVAANRVLQAGAWVTGGFKGVELAGKRLGLVGYGGIGREVTKLATALNLEVCAATSQTTPAELDELIASVDILSLHLPLNAQTRHLIDARRLSLMQPSAYLINTARGAIVDQTALLAALRENRIAGAALDVFAEEPVTGAPDAEIQALARLDNVVATPHIAYNTAEMTVRLGKELVQNVAACRAGKPINVVN